MRHADGPFFFLPVETYHWTTYKETKREQGVKNNPFFSHHTNMVVEDVTVNILGQMLTVSDIANFTAHSMVSILFVLILKHHLWSLLGWTSPYNVAPRISFIAKVGNFCLYPLFFFGIGAPFHKLSLSEIKKMASKITKLKDFGDDWYEAPYTETMDLVNNGGYSPIGFASAHDFFLRRLVAKLRIVNHLKNTEVS